MKGHGIESPCARLSKECAIVSQSSDTKISFVSQGYLKYQNGACLEILDRVTPSWYRPLQRMLTSGKRKKRPLFPWRSSSCSTTDTRLPYNIGGDRDWPLPMQDPISSDVRPSPENNDRCAIRNGNSVSLERVRKKIIRPTSRVLKFFFFTKRTAPQSSRMNPWQ